MPISNTLATFLPSFCSSILAKIKIKNKNKDQQQQCSVLLKVSQTNWQSTAILRLSGPTFRALKAELSISQQGNSCRS